MKRFLVLLTALLVYNMPSRAQSPEDSVKAAVNKLFQGMLKADTAVLQSAFSQTAVLQTIVKSADGLYEVKEEKISEFIASIGSLKEGDADERIQFEKILIDGPLAIAWTPYRFYYKGQFSHCGVNSFQLVRIHGTWKIQYIIDTRRKTGCAD